MGGETDPVRANPALVTAERPSTKSEANPRTVGLGTFAALPGAAIGFCGMFTYLLTLIIWQLDVDGAASGVVAALLPHPADWVTSALTLAAYGLPSSAVLGALTGLLVGWLLGRTTNSSSPGLGWMFGVLVAFALMIIVHLVLSANGLHVSFGQSTRLFTVPMIILVIEGGILGVWLQHRRAEMIRTAALEAARSEDD